MELLCCKECGYWFSIESGDGDSIYQTGYCGDCLAERVESGEEW